MSAEAAAYDCWAEYYDVLEGDRAPMVAFYASLVTTGTRSLLELACGTGAVTVAMAQRLEECASGAACRVAGVDLSTPMLEVASARDATIDWIRGDLREPPVAGPFDLVICCFNALQLLPSVDELARAFRTVRSLLSDDGRFAFDVYQPNIGYLSEPRIDRVARRAVDAQGRELKVMEDYLYDAAAQILTINWRLFRSDSKQPLAQTQFRLRQYFRDDVERALASAGLAIIERHGDLDGAPFTSASKRQVVVCSKS